MLRPIAYNFYQLLLLFYYQINHNKPHNTDLIVWLILWPVDRFSLSLNDIFCVYLL